MLAQALWVCLHDLSMVMLNTIIAIKTPGVSQNIQVVVLNLIQADILMTNNWLQEILDQIGMKIPFEPEKTYEQS